MSFGFIIVGMCEKSDNQFNELSAPNAANFLTNQPNHKNIYIYEPNNEQTHEAIAKKSRVQIKFGTKSSILMCALLTNFISLFMFTAY